MMASILNSTILNSAILDSTILYKTLIETNSIWLKLIHSLSTWWWQPSWILPSWIHPFCTKLWLKLIHSLSTWWRQPSWILPSWIHPFYTKKLHLFILTQLDDSSHLHFGHLGFNHLSFSLQTHPHLPRLIPTICTKKTSLIHSDSTWWWQPSWNMSCWIQTLPSWFQTPCYHLSDSLKNTLTPIWLWLKLIQSDSNSFILT